MEMLKDSDVDGKAIALVSKIRRVSLYSIIYGMVLMLFLALMEASYFSIEASRLLKIIAWPESAALILGGLWTYIYPSKASLLVCGIVHSLTVLSAFLFGLYVLGAGILFAIIYFVRFYDICNTPVTKEHLTHIKELKKQFNRKKPGDMIRIIVITLVDKRVWKCIIGAEQLMIRSQYQDEMHVGRREDISILGSNILRLRINVKFTLRMNGEIYRCKTTRPAYRKLTTWLEGGRLEMAN